MQKYLFLHRRLSAVAVATMGIALGAFNSAQAEPLEIVTKYEAPTIVLPSPDKEPAIVTPGTAGSPPADAIVLFDGKDVSKWQDMKGGDTKWVVENGDMISVKGAGYVRTKEEFGDFQLHVEWATPSEVHGDGQGRGNSGVFLHGLYEVQVLDSYNNKTYFHGQAGAVYKQHAPLVNVCRPPGQWQTYDIVFHGPKFDKDGKLTNPATVTVLQNGVLVQDHSMILGETSHDKPAKYKAYSGKGPLALQDHGNPVHFRNIWIRPL